MEPDQIEIRSDDMRKIILVLVLVFVVSGCGTTVNPSPSPTEINTPLPQPTVASSPTVIPSPSAVVPTSEPPLKTNGPYFTYFRQLNGVYQLVMMDADGAGRKVIELPQGFIDSLTNQYGLDMKLVSPNGKWLAFYTGAAGKWDQMPAQGESDLTLNLLNLVTGEKQIISPLLSRDYPNNFDEAAKQRNDPEITAGSLYGAFIAGIINAVDWSPDGRYLAFAGQMAGLSSDLYVYDMNTQKIQRLSSGDQELQWISWSPDGKWIAYGSAFWAGEGMQYTAYAVTKDGSVTRDLSTGYIDYWLNSHEYFVFDNGNGVGNFNLRLVDTNTGEITTVWRGEFHEYKVNASKDWLALVALTSVLPSEKEKPNFIPGLQLINLKTLKDIQNPDPLLDPPDTFVRADD